MAGGDLPAVKSFLGYSVLIGLIATWIAMSELLQDVQTDYEKPFFISCIVHSSYAWFLVIWLGFWMYGGHRGEVLNVATRYGVRYWQLTVFSLVSATLAFICAYAWYLSLTRTTVAANNSIYQSCSAIVYVFSIFILREKATWMKSCAVLVCIAGVVMVSTAPSSSVASSVTVTAMGYVYLMVSVIAYALYEVLQKKYLEKEVFHMDDDVRESPEHSESLIADMETQQIAPASVDAVVLDHRVEDDLSASPINSGRLRKRRSSVQSSGENSRQFGCFPPQSHFTSALPDLHSIRLHMELACFFLGLYGVWTMVGSIVFIPVWSSTGAEHYVSPPGHKLRLILLNSALDSIYNILLLFGILVTTPLFMSVGTMMVMPCSIVVDRLVHGTELGPSGIVGAIVIIVGFVMLNIPQETAARWYKNWRERCGCHDHAKLPNP